MTTQQDNNDASGHPPAGYVPAFRDADGQEDPAPEPVIASVAIPAQPGGNDEHADDGRFSVAEEISTDQQSDQARRVGQMPEAVDVPGTKTPDPATAVAETMWTPDAP